MNTTPTQVSKVLVVDDNPATLYATSRILRNAGFDVMTAETGTLAVEMAHTHPVDLIVLDINLPDIDGFEVLRRVRAQPETSTVRVVYLSASFVDDVHRVEGYEAGADAFLTHPVEPTVLVATIKALLRTRAVELQLEELLQRERSVRAEAEQANRAKDEFLATLSHELRSPLNAIVGWAEVARLRTDSEEVTNALKVIVRNARFQTQLISDLLDVSRITLGKLEITKEPLALAEVISAAVESMRSTAHDANVALVMDVSDDVGLIHADLLRLQQLITNLLSNAIKFSPRGTTVRITARREGQNAEFRVADQGRGIEPDILPRLFDRFWQADTTSRRSHSGLGLGLAIVKHVALLHGGTVRAESEGLDHGAVFTVTLPLTPGAPVAPTPVRSHVALGEASDLQGVRVLIVDDDEDSRLWVRRLLLEAGAEAMDVADVADALAAVETFRPHVVLSDLAMPIQDGFDLVGFLRTRGHTPTRLPAIALTAFAGAEHRQRALAASYQAFFAKPPDPQELLATVASLGIARRREESGEHRTRPAGTIAGEHRRD
ncbi:MAG TPA: response regulator [Gemmatimonadaceae bacterium]